MIYAIITLFLIILALPISLSVKVLGSIEDKKVFYSVKLFDFFKINSGFLDFTGNRAVLRYGRRKAKPLYYKDLLPNQNKTEIFKHIDVTKFSSAILIGSEEEMASLSASATLSNISATVYAILKTYKPYLKFHNDIILLEQGETSGCLFDSVLVFNGVSLIKIVVKKIYEGVLNYVQRKVAKQN